MVRAISPSSSDNPKAAQEERFSASQAITAITVTAVTSAVVLSLTNFIPISIEISHKEYCYESDVTVTNVMRCAVAIFFGITAGVAAIF